MLETVGVPVRDPQRFRDVLPPERFAELRRGIDEARELLAGRAVWNVNSTARGGGVVELLRPLVGYARGAGVDARWAVVGGEPGFYEVTKRIHNLLHGFEGDGLALDDDARRLYENTLAANVAELAQQIRPGDVVILHDPQTAAMAPVLEPASCVLIWRCHVGLDRPNDRAREAWAFLAPYVRAADACVFSRESFVWEGLDRGRVEIITPTIDVFTPKNAELAPGVAASILAASGLLADVVSEPPVFVRQDGTPGRVERRAVIVEDEPLRHGTPTVVQVSRWDALKDPVGVIRGFAEHVPGDTGAHLVYAGPSVAAVADDPEGRQVLQDSIAARAALPEETRRRVHLATLPMDDLDENAVIVNALQRHARVVVQKSLAEGFGLTVAEAMWKARPVVASRVGGIEEQIVHGSSGILLDDPHDLARFGREITGLLMDPERADRIGHEARERVRERFLSARSMLDYLALIRRVMCADTGVRPA